MNASQKRKILINVLLHSILFVSRVGKSLSSRVMWDNWHDQPYKYQNAGSGRALKSVNLQYDTLVPWDVRTKDSLTKSLIFQAIFFSMIFYGLGALRILQEIVKRK